MSADKAQPPTPEQWQHAIDQLLEVQRTLVASIDSGQVEEHDHHIVGLPSGIGGAMPGGARIEAALHAVMGARHLIQQAVTGCEFSGVPILERVQQDLALAGGYIAATASTELSERIDGRDK